MKRLGLSFLFALALAEIAQAGFDEGVTAYFGGDYETALREFKAAAEQGHEEAPFKLGAIYLNGLVVPLDYAAAAKWFRMAAEPNGD